MIYRHGDIINIDGVDYTICSVYKNHYKIMISNKFGLVDKKTNKIVLEPIYHLIIVPLLKKVYEILLFDKWGLADYETGKILIKPEYNSADELIKTTEREFI